MKHTTSENTQWTQNSENKRLNTKNKKQTSANKITCFYIVVGNMSSKVTRQTSLVVVMVLKWAQTFATFEDPDGIRNWVWARECFQGATGHKNVGHFGSTIGANPCPKRATIKFSLIPKSTLSSFNQFQYKHEPFVQFLFEIICNMLNILQYEKQPMRFWWFC